MLANPIELQNVAPLIAEAQYPQQPWWERLPDHFGLEDSDFAMNSMQSVVAGATGRFDNLLRASASSMVTAFAMPLGFRPKQIDQVLEQRAFYREFVEQKNVDAVFPQPPSGVTVSQIPATGHHFDVDDGECVDLMFSSPYETLLPGLRLPYARERNNRVGHARYWRHNDGPRPTIMAIHGFTADMYKLNEWVFALPWFYKMGYDVLLYTLPFHGPRKMRFSPYSGHGLFAGGLSWMNEAVMHGVYDFRILLNFILDNVGAPAAGVTGISLGGYHSAILACAEPRLAFSIPNVPVISLADIMLQWKPAGSVIREILYRRGLTVQDLREIIAIQSPLTWQPVLPKERRLIIGGVADRMAPPVQSKILWEHWDRCQTHWFPGSHVLHFDRGSYLRRMKQFFDSIDF